MKFSNRLAKFFKVAVISAFIYLPVLTPAFAQTANVDAFNVNEAIDNSARKQDTLHMSYAKRLKDKLDQFVSEYRSTVRYYQTRREKDNAAQIFLDAFIETIAGERVVSKKLEEQVRIQMIDDTQKTFSGNKEIEDGNSWKSLENPYAGIAIENQAKLKSIFDKYFCIPESKNASEECQERKSEVKPPYENFIDFFTGNGTWQTSKILEILTLGRAFYAGMTDKMMLGQGSYDPGSFYINLSNIAKANMRMSILNDLAAQRAPTSEATEPAEQKLLEILVPTGEIGSLDYKDVCSDSNQRMIGAYYACSMTSPPTDSKSDKRRISQAALDRILQFDYMLSSDFYSDINDPTLTAKGGADKIAVYLKSQQVAQDYRALRLIQMKVAATAMNMMNAK